MTTPNMNLNLPTVSTEPGPDWATLLNTALEAVDLHDHSNGKGVRVTPAGLDINSDLDISNQIFYNFKGLRFQEQSSALTGTSNSNTLQSVNGDLYFTSGAGTGIQITSGGSLAALPGSASIFETVAVSSNLTISNSDTFVYLIVDTSTTREITLPLASGVSNGRIYLIKDSTGQSEANPITINIQGSDTLDGLNSSITLNSNYGLTTIVGDGNSSWFQS